MKNKSIIAFLIAILTSSFSHAILILLKKIAGEPLIYSDMLFGYLFTIITLFVIIFVVFRTYGWEVAKFFFKKEVNQEINNLTAKKLLNLYADNNIEHIYPNMHSCIEDICNDLSTSKDISIFVQIGREILSGKGIFYKHLKKNQSPDRIRILHSSVRTPYLSSKQALKRSKGKLEEWKLDLTSVEQSGKQLSALYNIGIFETRAHHEGYYCRIFLFENHCYVQPYIFRSSNSEKAPIIKVKKTDNSVYHTFKKFFDNKWIEFTPNTYYLNDFIKESFPVSVTAILKYDSLYIFSVPERYVAKEKLQLQAVGGKTDGSETFKEALIREIKEEINAEIEIFSSSYTTYIHEGGIQLSESFHDNPAPYCIYRRDISDETRDKRIRWILLYQAEANLNSINDLKPTCETDTIVCLSQELLRQLAHPTIVLTIRDVLEAKDGSCIISPKKYKNSMELEGRGMVSVISAATLPSFNTL
ncbi:MAG: hypothetical protein K8R67_14065 [Desulfobacteraceae bacterium]|nr:hypothetical protein [Desulfobacteraceae bacterium]